MSPVNPGFEGAKPLATFGIFKASGCPKMHTWAWNMVYTMLFAHLGHHQVFVSVTGLNEDQNWLENDEVAALKWLQFRSGSGQLRV